MSEQIRLSHALRVLSRVTRMKENEFICDFSIKVGDKSFPTHRTVLAASSDYFEALFSSKMKEAMQGYVEMKGLGVKGVQQSIEFMYTGNAQISLEYIDDILHAADLFQLDDLKNLCFQYLSQNLSPGNCLVIANLAEKYNRQDIRDKSEGIIVANLKVVISSDMFPSITKSDLLGYISKVEHQTSWQAAVAWGKDKDEFPQLVEKMDIQKFPFTFLWQTVLEEPLVKQSHSIKTKVIKGLFSDPKELKDNLQLENCILFKSLAKEHNIPDATVQVITQFMEENFEELTAQPSFNDLSKDDLLSLLGSPSTKCSSETVKWESALKWVKHDLRQRKKVFSDIFGLIKLEKLSTSYLNNRVRSESLVKESRKCMDILMDIFVSKSLELEASASKPASETDGAKSSVDSTNDEEDAQIIEGNQPLGQMHRETLQSSLPGYEGYWTIEITYTFPEGSLNGVFYKSKEFKAYVPAAIDFSGRPFYPRLERAFKAGAIFKLRYKRGETTGKIVWGDIPHKTNKTGGPDNNGYPDRGYENRLHEALKAKGFWYPN